MSSKYSSRASTGTHSRASVGITPPFYFEEHESQNVPAEFDIAQLLEKLEQYKANIDEHELRINQQRSISPREAAEVAAAARFKEELDRLGLAEGAGWESPVVSELRCASPDYFSIHFSEQQAVQHSINEVVQERRRAPKHEKRSRPTLAKLQTSGGDMPEVVQNVWLPPRTSSKMSPRLEDSFPISPVSAKLHRRRVTISDSRYTSEGAIHVMSPHDFSFDFGNNTPPLPSLSHTTSSATPRVSPVSATPLSMCSPKEDQIRREMETLAFHDRPEMLKQRARRDEAHNLEDCELDFETAHVGESAVDLEALPEILSVPARELAARPDREVHLTPVPMAEPIRIERAITSSSLDEASAAPKPTLRRKKSLFKMFERKSEVDKLIEMYMDDEQLEEPVSPKLKSSRSIRMPRLRRAQTERMPIDGRDEPLEQQPRSSETLTETKKAVDTTLLRKRSMKNLSNRPPERQPEARKPVDIALLRNRSVKGPSVYPIY